MPLQRDLPVAEVLSTQLSSDGSPCTWLFAQAGALVGVLTCRCKGAVALKVGGRIVPEQWVGSQEAQVCRRQAMPPSQLLLPAWPGAT